MFFHFFWCFISCASLGTRPSKCKTVAVAKTGIKVSWWLPPGAHPGLPKGEGPPRGNSAQFFLSLGFRKNKKNTKN